MSEQDDKKKVGDKKTEEKPADEKVLKKDEPTVGPKPDDKEPEKKFTQDDVDRIVKDRLKREGAKFADYDDLKAKATAHDKAEEDKKSELQKAEEAKEKAEAAGKEAVESAKKLVMKSAVIAKASEMNFTDPQDAFALVDKTDISVDDEGEVSGIDEPLKALAKAKPYMLKEKKPVLPKDLKPGLPGDARPEGETIEQKRARIYGGGSDIFTPEGAAKSGGGVMFDPTTNRKQRADDDEGPDTEGDKE